MGPRVAGFLIGGFVTAMASAVLLQYDVLRKQELTTRKTEEVVVQADMIVHRFHVVEAGLRTLSEGVEARHGAT
ncbi:hypothetical protein LMXM_04_0035 [Leishmania mexicana MHOM/GT/2001/U1103]|uniref:Uncharacterized protein n=1 Tax=Leishmania mexicana (strain MHOM/GT/2001/U1103) TaxID=929439 RepID=E9AJY6_LEIMU|nr:hypothetical protein LMXM_04_0035 [Leishmania mexicana MHOM/GT/2001/U1103]CBZ23236.1 hypothetical protein LMXM_04_0035 [Leishmania mexicana MHOM/GT/2001/U1103]